MEEEDSVFITINDEVDGVRKKFEAESYFRGMKATMYRFPVGLRGMFKSNTYIAPEFVAIGPYHKGEKQLKKMEEVKKAAAYYFCELMELEPKEVMEQMEATEALKQARGGYGDHIMEGTSRKNGHSASFAAMMFYDACFLLLYMLAYTSSPSNKEVYYQLNPSLLRFLFANRDIIDNDIMLLENQLPWPVLQALMNIASEEDKERYKYLVTAVGKFIAGMGNTFNGCVTSDDPKPYAWDDKKDPPPPHLLALLRRHKTERRKPERSNRLPPTLGRPLLSNCFKFKKGKTTAPNETAQTESYTQEEDHRFTLMPTVSPMELEEIGIRLKGSQTATFSDMDFVEGRLWSDLSLAPLSLSYTQASCLVNMAAFEVCISSRFGDHHDSTAVCSYLALLDMLMVREEDVHTLRAKGLVQGPHSNKEIFTFFKTVTMHLPDKGSRYAHIMKDIAEYKAKRYITNALYKWFYNNYMGIIMVISILVAFIGICRALLPLAVHN